jgi:uncharacterized membrane protein
MENVARTNIDNLLTSQAIINSPLVIKNLQQHSLKEILADYSNRQQLAQPSLIDRAAEAIGLTPNIQVEKTVTIERPASELYSYWRNLTKPS